MKYPEKKKYAQYRKVVHPLDAAQPFLLYDQTENGPLEPPGDIHFAPQIIIVIAGTMRMEYRNCEILCRPGECCLTGPWEKHRARREEGRVRYLVITIDLLLLGSISPFHDLDWLQLFLLSPEKRPRFTSRRDRARLLGIVRSILHMERAQMPGYKSGQWLEIHRLIWLLAARIPAQMHDVAGKFRQLYPALLLARDEVHRLVSLDEASAACGLSRSRFAATFKQRIGIPFGEFAMRGRIAAAGKSLLRKDSSIKQIAEEYGFSDVSHFYRSFRKVTGITPGAFCR